VCFQVIASDSKNRAAISRRHRGTFSTVPQPPINIPKSVCRPKNFVFYGCLFCCSLKAAVPYYTYRPSREQTQVDAKNVKHVKKGILLGQATSLQITVFIRVNPV
jgi:hypothetical protein